MSTKSAWCVAKHNETNHFYDTYLPYEFHLRMVARVANEYIDLIKDRALATAVIDAAWGHDLIEDARCSYNDVFKMMGPLAADIVYAVTNEKGRDRKERANDRYYTGIVNTPGAVFVKVCDRIANVQYSKMTKSRMFEMYKKENQHFVEQLGFTGDVNNPLHDLFTYLLELFETNDER